MEREYTLEELIEGYKEVYELNKKIAEEMFKLESEAELATYENL